MTFLGERSRLLLCSNRRERLPIVVAFVDVRGKRVSDTEQRRKDETTRMGRWYTHRRSPSRRTRFFFLAVRASSVSQRSSSEAGKEAATSGGNDAYLDQTIVE